jgi:hypothetical protein
MTIRWFTKQSYQSPFAEIRNKVTIFSMSIHDPG